MPGREHIHAAAREGEVLRRERSQVLRLFALGFAIVAALAIAVGAMLSAAQAAPQGLGALKQFRVPTDNSQPRHITAAPDGNMWFTQTLAGNVARITPQGVITEGKSVNSSEPFGITMGPDGQSVWYTMMSANKIARLTPR